MQGVDLEASYHSNVHLVGGPESVAVRLYATDLIKNATLTQFGTYDEWAGQVGTGRSLPKHKYTANFTYNNGAVLAVRPGALHLQVGSWTTRWYRAPVAIPGVQTINDNSIGGLFYLDLNLAIHGAGAGRPEHIRRSHECPRPCPADHRGGLRAHGGSFAQSAAVRRHWPSLRIGRPIQVLTSWRRHLAGSRRLPAPVLPGPVSTGLNASRSALARRTRFCCADRALAESIREIER